MKLSKRVCGFAAFLVTASLGLAESETVSTETSAPAPTPLLAPTAPVAEKLPVTKTFDLTARGVDVRQVLKLISKKSGVPVLIAEEVTGSVNYSGENVSVEEVLGVITQKLGLKYHVSKGKVTVYRPVDRALASVVSDDPNAVPTGPSVEIIRLHYAKAKDIETKITSLFGSKTLRVISDETTNSIAVANAKGSMGAIREYVAAVDRVPKQILIEAQIVETTDNFARDLGMTWGTPAPTARGMGGKNLIASVNNPLPTNAPLNLGYRFGTIDQQALSARLSAAESNGEAKVISRPKIVTADRASAVIQSGLTYYVKVLGSSSNSDSSSGSSRGTSSGGANGGAIVNGGLQQVKAGLNLEVKPIIVASDLIQLTVDISNGEADRGGSVDGIPGVINNSAKTSLTIKEGVTATIAGLIKNHGHNSDTGIPGMGRIPLLGWLFKSTSVTRGNNELVIFITPHILNTGEGAASPDPAARPVTDLTKL